MASDKIAFLESVFFGDVGRSYTDAFQQGSLEHTDVNLNPDHVQGHWMSNSNIDTKQRKAVSADSSKNQRRSTCATFFFFGLFLLIGVAVFTFMTFLPVYRTYQARKWVETPCTITSANVETHDGDDGDTYSIEVSFRYQFDGQEYGGNRYDFSIGSTSGRSGKQKIVTDLRRNRESLCFVNPDQPSESVLRRSIPTIAWFGLIAIPFMAIGAGGLLHVTGLFRFGSRDKNPYRWKAGGSPLRDPRNDFKRRDEFERRDDWRHGVSSFGEVTLKPESSPLTSFIVLTLIALFWNGIVSIFVVHVVGELTDGKIDFMDMFLTLFMTPFVLVGLGLTVAIGYSMLALFNPRPTLTVSSSGVKLGDTVRVSWSFSGNTNSVRRLHIFMHGQEEARYRRGTNTYTDHETFAKLTIIDTTNFIDITSGEAELTIRSDTMHSFEANNNKILWSLDLSGEIAWWPDVSASFPFTVLSHNS